MSPLAERGTSPYTYFYRIIGYEDQREYLANIKELDEKLKLTGNYIVFDKTIPVSTDSVTIERVRKLFEPAPLKDYRNGALINVLESKGFFSVSSDIRVNQRIKQAFGIVLNHYLKNEKSPNLSILMNFCTKILLWFGDYGKHNRNKSPYNPKVIYWGSPQKHEIYFLILMSLIGYDVLVLNTSFKDKFEKVDKDNQFSMVIKHSKELLIDDFPGRKIQEQENTKTDTNTNTAAKTRTGTRANPSGLVRPALNSETPVTKASADDSIRRVASPKEESVPTNRALNRQKDLTARLLNDPVLVVKLKRTEKIFEEILVPLNSRTGYVGEPYPILPAYFVRYIGVPSSTDDWEAEYYNSLYNLDKTLRMSGLYLKFSEGIPAPSAEESALIPHNLISYAFQDRFEIIEQTLRAKLLPQTYDELLDNTIRKTFVDIVHLFAEKSSNANTSILLNFSLKLISWLNRYVPQLFPRLNRNRKSGNPGQNYEHNPKVLFYGPIKAHEIFLLTAFHKLGCDVLYVHSEEEGDKPFQSFDEENALTHLIRNRHNLSLAPFPQGERLIRKSTIAYNASKEIEEVIYSEEVGLFKPWQFESYGTQPITLKTTYDELKILWKEPVKLRPEFKIQNKKVYVPNLFAKINGVSEDLNDYWQDLKELSSASNTKLIEAVPFTKITYSKQDLYQTSYLLNKKGLLEEFEAAKSRHYKFGHLKAPLQHFLIAKINELLLSEMFLGTVDKKFKLKIIMTILTMDDELLRLIEVFDYPQEVPKVIVYDNKKETFTESDSIMLAYLNLIGLDIVVFTPTNYKTIEHYIKPSLFDCHQLPFVKYDLQLPALDSIQTNPTPKLGLLSRLFKLR
ncbi:YceG family protein [Desulfosporosinus youngiae]|uniref:YceG family protein n=1 Tax=Desulfosporosinus youngiae TaxID=339862 RepID=UPI0031F449ED